MAVIVSWASISLPEPEYRTYVSWSGITIPEPGPGRAYVSWTKARLPAGGGAHEASGAIAASVPSTVVSAALHARLWTDEVGESFVVTDLPSEGLTGVVEHPTSGALGGVAATLSGLADHLLQIREHPLVGVLAPSALSALSGAALRIAPGLFSYPALPRWQGTKLVPRTGIYERLALSGVYQTHRLQDTVKYDPIVVHQMLTAAQRQELLDFYAAMSMRSFEYVDETALSRVCIFAGDSPLQIEPVPDYPGYFNASVKLREL